MFWSLHILLLVTGGLLLSPLLLCEAEEYYVRPTQFHDPACPAGKPCHTLDDYAKNSTSLFFGKDNVSLLFLDGVHMLMIHNLEISNTTNLTMAGVNISYSKVDGPSARIELSYKWNVSIDRVLILRMEHLLIVNTIHTEHPLVIPQRIIRVSFVSQFVHYHFALVNCDFIFEETTEILLYNSTYLGGLLQMSYNGDELHGSHFYVCIHACSMLKGVRTVFPSDSTNDQNLEVNVENSIMQDSGLIFFIQFFEKAILSILNCTISASSLDLHLLTHVFIEDSYLVGSSVHLIFIVPSTVDFNYTSFLMRNVIFNETGLVVIGPANVTIDGCLFQNNHHADLNTILSPVVMYSIDLLFVGDILFVNNAGYQGGAMYLYRSVLYLEEGANITFVNNTAKDVGGAIYVYTGWNFHKIFTQSEMCSVQLTYNVNDKKPLTSSMHFVNNSAQNGGENIYGISLKSYCSITPNGGTTINDVNSKLFQFHHEGSSSLSPVSSDPKRVCLCENGKTKCANYSFIVQERSYTSGEKFNVSLVLVGDDFGTVTGGVQAIINSSDSHSSNSSLGPGQKLQQVNNHECSELEYSIHSRSSEECLVLVADSIMIFQATDQGFFNQNDLNDSIHNYQIVGVIDYELLLVPILLNITFLPCPLGFTLVGDLPTCQCIELLVNNGIDNCVVTNGTGLVYRNGTVWVSHYASEDNETDSVLVHKYCPYGYCKTNYIAVDLYNPDKQCAFNHSGILCGGCPENFSLVLGSSQCRTCSNDGHIALLLVFIIAGFALVFLSRFLISLL